MLLSGCAGLTSAAELRSDFNWVYDHPEFGGLSGFEVSDDGARYLAVTDSAFVFSGSLLRDMGQISSVTVDYVHQLTRADGSLLTGAKADAEGLAIDDAGRIYVSYEGVARVAIYDDIRQPALKTVRSPVFADLQFNSSLEAVAVNAEGAIYTIPERSGRATRPFPVYRYFEGEWSVPFALPRRGAYLIVGADIGPDERLYILERDFTGIGFRTRVRRFDLTGAGETVLLETSNGKHDNLEGLSVWTDERGRTVLSMISDDNFKFFQRTEIVEYIIDD